MPNNCKITKYVLRFENSNFIFNDFQYVLFEGAKYCYCSQFHIYEYSSLLEAKMH